MPAQATKSRSGFAFFACWANGVKSVARQRHRDLGDVVTAEERLHGRVVAVAEHAVLVEDDDLLAGRLAEVRLRGEHVLDRLPPGAERVLVDAGDRVGGGRAGDVQHLVLRGERSDLHRDAGRAGAHQDLVPCPIRSFAAVTPVAASPLSST